MSETYADPQSSPQEPARENDPVETVTEGIGGSTDEEGAVPNSETGAGIGADTQANTFEPEEDPAATEDPA